MAGDTQAVTLALIQAQAQARADLLEITRASVLADVRTFTGWYDHAAITLMTARLAKVVRAGQKRTATSTDTFAVRLLTTLTGKRPAALGPVPVADLRGVPLEAVYGRLADQFRYLAATRGPGAPDALLERPDAEPLARLSNDDILDRVAQRAEVQTDDNLSLAFRAQWGAAMAATASTVTGYRRVIHPELVAVGSDVPGPVCGLCIVASDRVYGKDELMPLHARCRCSVSAVVGDADGEGDPGSAINAADLKRIYKAAGGTAAKKLKATKIQIVDNPETGPRLVIAGHKSRTPADVRKDTNRR